MVCSLISWLLYKYISNNLVKIFVKVNRGNLKEIQ